MVFQHQALLRPAIYGVAVGDALGVPYEFMARGGFRCTDMVGYGSHRQPAGTWSDDTSMTLATVDSLRQNDGRVDVDDMRRRFVMWLCDGMYAIDGNVFDCGITVREALRRGVGRDGERSNGNGSLMRILPLAFTDATDDEVRAVSAITHAHATSMDACVAYVHAARALLNGADPREAAATAGYADIWEQPVSAIRSTGYVLHTLPAALWCLTTTGSYADCVRAAVNLGEDTDTTAAVAGGLAAIQYHGGSGDVSQDWLERLRGREIIESVLPA